MYQVLSFGGTHISGLLGPGLRLNTEVRIASYPLQMIPLNQSSTKEMLLLDNSKYFFTRKILSLAT